MNYSWCLVVPLMLGSLLEIQAACGDILDAMKRQQRASPLRRA
ncbi:unnamed protein product [Amoebophrya sp. A25]|nr:unnamed protein product [Amoebophrya sp. A25]|eukprot:GSA25T00027435001.1